MSVHQAIRHHDILSLSQITARLAARDESRAPIMGEAAVPDLSATVGLMIVASYGAIMAAFFMGFAHDRDAVMMVVISALYTVVYLTVPAVMLHIEGQSERPGLSLFMRDGLNTFTGHLSGRTALIQILLIPSAIAIAVSLIAVVAAVIT